MQCITTLVYCMPITSIMKVDCMLIIFIMDMNLDCMLCTTQHFSDALPKNWEIKTVRQSKHGSQWHRQNIDNFPWESQVGTAEIFFRPLLTTFDNWTTKRFSVALLHFSCCMNQGVLTEQSIPMIDILKEMFCERALLFDVSRQLEEGWYQKTIWPVSWRSRLLVQTTSHCLF